MHIFEIFLTNIATVNQESHSGVKENKVHVNVRTYVYVNSSPDNNVKYKLELKKEN
jgi:hypothetical protein